MPLRTLPSRPSTVPSALPPIEGLAGSTFVDFYELLGVEDTATPEEIKAAYRQMAKVCHPDVHDEGHDVRPKKFTRAATGIAIASSRVHVLVKLRNFSFPSTIY